MTYLCCLVHFIYTHYGLITESALRIPSIHIRLIILYVNWLCPNAKSHIYKNINTIGTEKLHIKSDRKKQHNFKLYTGLVVYLSKREFLLKKFQVHIDLRFLADNKKSM